MIFLVGNTVLMSNAYRAGSDMFFFFLFCAALSLALGSRTTNRTWILAGLVGGLAYLTRYNGLVLFPILLGAAWLGRRQGSRHGWALVLGTWLVVCLPWLAYLAAKTGSPFWSLNHLLLAEEAYVGDPNLANSSRFVPEVGFTGLGEVLRADPPQVLRTWAGNLPQHFLADWSKLAGWGWGGAALAGWGLLGWSAWRRRQVEARVVLFALSGVLVFLAVLPVFYNVRFMIPLLPWWAVGFGLLCSRLPGFWNRLRPGVHSLVPRTAWTVLALLAVVGMARHLVLVQAQDDLPTELVPLAQKARASGREFGSDTPLCARKPHLAAQLGVPFINMGGKGKLEDIRQAGARYVLVSATEAHLFPQLRSLIVDGAASPVPEVLNRVAMVPLAALFEFKAPLPAPARVPLWERTLPGQGTGLKRLDQVRLNLARWYLRWLPDRPLLRVLERISAEGIAHPLVRLGFGDALLAEGRVEDARQVFQDLSAVNSGLSERAHLRLALLEWWQGRPAESRNQLQQALGDLSLPDMVDRAMQYKSEADFPAAAAVFLHVRDRDGTPSSEPALRELGYCFLNMRRFQESEAAYRRYLELHPEDRLVRLVLDSDKRLLWNREQISP
jgi:hypothetical protein